MFDNLLYQNAASLLKADILSNKLPGAILLSGPASSGKLTCALEIARILSCSGRGTQALPRGHWLCDCPSCKKNKELTNADILLAGPRDCSLEILAAKKAFLSAALNNSSHLMASRYFFIRAVRKLTMRFSQILWESDEKVSKISPVIQTIDEQMETFNPDKDLPENDKLEKILTKIIEQCDKLESSFMYDSLPINQIRNASNWARLKSNGGKKVLIIENAERMLEATRNALLKILEEPPSDTVFILTTSRRGAVMQTILSRVRTYSFSERTIEQQSEVIDRVFHAAEENHKHQDSLRIDDYLQTFLPVSIFDVNQIAKNYYETIKRNQIPPADKIVKSCAGFEPRFLFKIFLAGILNSSKDFMQSAQNCDLWSKNLSVIGDCYNNVTIYNQSPVAAIEKLTRDLTVNRAQLFR
ncbi:DNA polymerase III [Treponema zioleckii]|uniref:DNA polymerase III n=1 Tax=Treponema zioleckii TaxID=331680 RepID=UPI00168ACEC5|nr:DNA polymerase III [Treponema zioleckii]